MISHFLIGLLIGVTLLLSHRDWDILALAFLLLFQMDRAKVLYKEKIFQQEAGRSFISQKTRERIYNCKFLKGNAQRKAGQGPTVKKKPV